MNARPVADQRIREVAHVPVAPQETICSTLFGRLSRGLRLTLCALCLVWLLPACPIRAASSSPKLPLLTAARAVHNLPLDEALRGYPVHLKAIVTCYDPFIDHRHVALFVVDRSGGVFVSLSSRPAVDLRAGQLIDIEGVSAPGDFAPVVGKAHATVIGQATLPRRAPRVGMLDLLTGNYDGQWVELEGVVYAIRVENNEVFVHLSMRDGDLWATTVSTPGFDYSRLINAVVLLRGSAAPLFNHLRQMTGVHLLFPGTSAIHVETPPPANPFDLPLTPVRNLLRYEPSSSLHRRVRVQGVVTLFWPGRRLCIADGAQGLCAQTTRTDPLALGDEVEVVGFPKIGDFTPSLSEAIYRRIRSTSLIQPVSISAQQALDGNFDSRLVTLDGQVLNENREAADPTIILSSKGIVFPVSLPGKAMLGDHPPLERGSWLRVTGLCSVEADSSEKLKDSGFPVGRAFEILQRSPSDVVILGRPSWWNSTHSLMVLALASFVAIVALSAVVLLRRQVKQQTAVIRSQLAETIALKNAAEFQATHDGLTGLQNRNAIFSLLHREFDLDQRAGPSTGIIMMDLDHFKQINDTYGHAVGDKVLREAAERIVAAVRSSDLVGRYGGEEFLIVLPHCDHHQCRACAERVRLAIASDPVILDGFALHITASLGTACAVSHVHNEHEALVAADQALYYAKKSGRNQVVFFDLHTQEIVRPALPC